MRTPHEFEQLAAAFDRAALELLDEPAEQRRMLPVDRLVLNALAPQECSCPLCVKAQEDRT